MMSIRTLLFAALCAMLSPAHATQNDLRPPGDPSRATRLSAEAMKAHADDSSGLRHATLGKMEGEQGTLNVHGRTVTFERGRVKVFDAAGREIDAAAIPPGARVRFTVDPNDPAHRRPAVLYIN